MSKKKTKTTKTTQATDTKPPPYELTPEHSAQLDGWRDLWISRVMSCRGMDDTERDICRIAVKGLYEAADLKPPAPEHIYFVESPFTARFFAGFAAHALSKGKPMPTLEDFAEPVETPSLSHWYVTTRDYGAIAERCGGKPALEAAEKAHEMLNGGNQWGAWAAYISFFRHVAKLGETHGVDYSKWRHYEDLAIHSGPRYMHETFCVISDRPELLTTDAANEPHNETGPFCRWRDGSALYAVGGHRVPAWILESPSDITVENIGAETNAETKRIMIERFGPEKYLRDVGAKVLDMDSRTNLGAAPRALMEDTNGLRWLVGTDGSTKRVYIMAAPSDANTCQEAHLALSGAPSEDDCEYDA